ncbi:MAG: hypothetical protein JW774_06610 [Candidatus Aureabacteria bacterium]|nr:hypothetical protein [Candidatus Auribacterota bacterium]
MKRKTIPEILMFKWISCFVLLGMMIHLHAEDTLSPVSFSAQVKSFWKLSTAVSPGVKKTDPAMHDAMSNLLGSLQYHLSNMKTENESVGQPKEFMTREDLMRILRVTSGNERLAFEDLNQEIQIQLLGQGVNKYAF